MFLSEYTRQDNSENISFFTDSKIEINRKIKNKDIMLALGQGDISLKYDEFSFPKSHQIVINFLSNNHIQIYTDNMASLPVFYHRNHKEILVSNRLDWICRFSKEAFTPNWKQIFYFTFQSSCIGNESIMDAIEVLGAGSVLKIQNRELTTDLWFPYPFTSSVVEPDTEKLTESLCNAIYDSCKGKNKDSFTVNWWNRLKVSFVCTIGNYFCR